MKKSAAIFFLLVFLFSQTPLQQLLKLPILIEHYKEHKGGNSELSFLQFLQSHYFNGESKDGDYARDQQLPFKTKEVVLMNATVVLTEQMEAVTAPVICTESTYSIFHAKNISSSCPLDIWRPPATC